MGGRRHYRVCFRAVTSAARTRGDPHIGTLDGRQYSFNGLCEYLLMRSTGDAPHMQVQARTALAPTHSENATSRATVFSGFALEVVQPGESLSLIYNKCVISHLRAQC